MKINRLLQLNATLILPVLLPASVMAATTPDLPHAGAGQKKTPTLIVTANPAGQGLSELDTPAAVSVAYGDEMRHASPQVNLSEGLAGIPGLQILNRQNYAQDLQLSIRGFGARSTFGVRGLRIYVDGIPATMPDGQGQTSNIDISSIDHVDVLRGPFSALYGNSSGGVINVVTEQGKKPDTVSVGSWYGSYGSWRNSMKASGAVGDGTHAGDVDYTASVSRFTTHGYRNHSSAEKNLANARLGVRIDDSSTLTLLFNTVHIDAYDPGGLTPAMWRDNPKQVAGNVDLYNARKSVDQTQAGLHYLRSFGDNDDLSIMTYAGIRSTVQYQSIPAKTQTATTGHSGGVIDLTRRYQGIDTRWTHRDTLFTLPLSITGGLDYETMTEVRKGYNNFTGTSASIDSYGEEGDLRRNENNKMWNLDPYLQTAWQLSSQWSLDAGLRYSSVSFASHDHYLSNGDDSGSTRYHHWLPAASLKYAIDDSWNTYLSAGKGFETPTITELSYRPDGQKGLNLGLKPSTNKTIEWGTKKRIGFGLLTASVFQTDTKDEIVADTNEDGRSTYKNAGKTRRRGMELGFEQQFAENWQLKMAWTLLDARYLSNSCNSGDCTGNRIPGIAKNMAYAGLAYAPESGWYAGADIRYMSHIEANDQNTVNAPAYAITSLNTGYKWLVENWTLDVSGSVNNLFNKKYIGSVIVDESNGRYYEPAPGRNYGVGLNVSYAFR